jgi:hypothetical protein
VPLMLKGANAGGAYYPVLTRSVPADPPPGQFRLYAKSAAPSLFYRDNLGHEYELRPAATSFDSSYSSLRSMVESYAVRVLVAENFR